jgi:hypothetical protein
MYKNSSGQTVQNAREARQGYLDRPVLVVLTVGTGLAIAALLALWLIGT